jgi:hypothetical protein
MRCSWTTACCTQPVGGTVRILFLDRKCRHAMIRPEEREIARAHTHIYHAPKKLPGRPFQHLNSRALLPRGKRKESPHFLNPPGLSVTPPYTLLVPRRACNLDDRYHNSDQPCLHGPWVRGCARPTSTRVFVSLSTSNWLLARGHLPSGGVVSERAQERQREREREVGRENPCYAAEGRVNGCLDVARAGSGKQAEMP